MGHSVNNILITRTGPWLLGAKTHVLRGDTVRVRRFVKEPM